EGVGDRGALESPLSAEQVGEQTVVRGCGQTVVVVVGVHDRACPAVAYGHLERGQEDVGEFAWSDGDGGEVAPGAGGGVADEVFEGRHDAGGLQSADVGGADGSDEEGILADGFFSTSPTYVVDDVEDGGQALVHADLAHALSDLGGHLFDQVGVEAGAPGQGNGVDRRGPGGKACQALLVRQGRDAESVRGHDLSLAAGQGEASCGRVHGRGSGGAGELAESVGDDIGPGGGFLGVVLVRGDRFPAGVGADPHPVELGHLFLQGHFCQETLDAL